MRCSMGAGCLQPLGMEGWRFAFLSVAILSLAIGVLTFLFGHDPRFTTDKHIALPKAEAGQAPPSFLQLLKETKNICIVPTFIIIITQAGTASGILAAGALMCHSKLCDCTLAAPVDSTATLCCNLCLDWCIRGYDFWALKFERNL